MSLPAFGVRKPVVANLVMFALVGAGVIFGLNLRKEFFPEVRPNTVMVRAPYPGASPSEVESSLAIKIEDRVADLDDVKEINTTISEGGCSVQIEFQENVPIEEAIFDVKREMDALQDLPEEAERITVDKFEPNLPVINVTLYGDADERSMKEAIHRIRDDLRSIDGMGSARISGVRADEIVVEVEPAALIKHNISLPFVADRVRQAMIELPSGSVRTGTSNIAIRATGAEETPEAVRDIVIKSDPGGQVLRLSEIATVRQSFEDIDLYTRVNGKPAVSVTIYKVGKQDAVEMAEVVKAYVAGRQREAFEPEGLERVALMAPSRDDPGAADPVSPRHEAYLLGLSRPLPPGELIITTDLARFIVGRLDLLLRNAKWGGILVLMTLVILLNFRVAFWVAVGLGVSILATLAAMHFLNQSLNLLSMFGLIIVLGLLVDDAIVVAENITARHENGEPAKLAAVRGTNIVLWPVVATVLTTICAFMPLSLIEGSIGDLLSVLPVVVAIALAVSLIECLFILPCHMAHSLTVLDRKHEGRAGFLQRIEFRFDFARDAFFRRLLIPTYTRLVTRAVRYRYITVAAVLSMVFVSLGMVAGGRVPFTFFAASDAETVSIELRMPVGTPVDQTDRYIRRIERVSLSMPEVSSAWAIVGSISSMDGGESSQQTHIGQVILELTPVEVRTAKNQRDSGQVIEAIRRGVGELPGAKSLRMTEVSGGPEGTDFSLTVVGERIDRIMRVVGEVKHALGEYTGVRDIADDSERGRRELRISLRPGADQLGFTPEIVARQVRAAVFGLEAHTFPGEHQEDVDVRVTLPEQTRRSLSRVENLFLITPDGRAVPMCEAVDITETEGYATIRRLDRQRAITVMADAVDGVANPEEVMRELTPRLKEIEAANPGIRIVERGRQQDVQDSFRTLPIGFLVACGLIYVVLTWLFSSYTQPLIVLTAVPFAVIGMIWGHFFLVPEMTILSLIGFIALAGVVVNDSLIFVEFYNHKRSEGLGVQEAGIEAGRARLRAILLTTVTTVLGLMPLMLEQSFQARFLIPMAVTIACGLISATVIILVVLPSLLVVGDDLRRLLRFLWGSSADTPYPSPERLDSTENE